MKEQKVEALKRLQQIADMQKGTPIGFVYPDTVFSDLFHCCGILGIDFYTYCREYGFNLANGSSKEKEE